MDSTCPSSEDEGDPHLRKSIDLPRHWNDSQNEPGPSDGNGGPARPELSQFERQRLMAEGRCFVCRKRGHRFGDCRQNEQAARHADVPAKELRVAQNDPDSTTSDEVAECDDDTTESGSESSGDALEAGMLFLGGVSLTIDSPDFYEPAACDCWTRLRNTTEGETKLLVL
ncbi:hypothetical protein PLEOSDRAFT_1100725 [Pleurotus ostreatus PC15]|uniref:CCHC-type domain-containing protein n=1 Tax=Pleurotus ostreatus (strain PC15) TaxID=1137138 RepID=A0A067NWB8_PLEO1|nr:hypothetical protein PLEOSDRAFT_1100725 [Pleurotus ostreatus PC15]